MKFSSTVLVFGLIDYVLSHHAPKNHPTPPHVPHISQTTPVLTHHSTYPTGVHCSKHSKEQPRTTKICCKSIGLECTEFLYSNIHGEYISDVDCVAKSNEDREKMKLCCARHPENYVYDSEISKVAKPCKFNERLD